MFATVIDVTKWGLWLVMSCALLLVACSASDESGSSLKDPEGTLAPIINSDIRQARDLVRHPPTRDDLAGRAEPTLSAQVDLDQVLVAATAGSSAEHGEDFAVLATIYLADDENGTVGPPEIATLVAADEKPTAEYIYNQMGIPERLGFEPATIDAQERPWLRTQVVAPDRVRTELALYVLYPGVFEDRDGSWVDSSPSHRECLREWRMAVVGLGEPRGTGSGADGAGKEDVLRRRAGLPTPGLLLVRRAATRRSRTGHAVSVGSG